MTNKMSSCFNDVAQRRRLCKECVNTKVESIAWELIPEKLMEPCPKGCKHPRDAYMNMTLAELQSIAREYYVSSAQNKSQIAEALLERGILPSDECPECNGHGEVDVLPPSDCYRCRTGCGT